MYEKLLTEAEKYIEGQKTREVPILDMWDAMMELSEEQKFEMPENIGDFECLIEADKRFIFINTKTTEEMDDVDIGEEEGEYEVGEDFFEVEEMEKLGFNQHQVIGLKKYEKKKSADDDDDDTIPVPSKSLTKKKTAAPMAPKKKPSQKPKPAPKKKKKK